MSEAPTPEKAPPKSPGAAGRLLLDLGPLLVFFLVNFLAPVPDVSRIFVATGAFMVAMLAAMAVSQLRYRFISPLLWFSALMVVVLGGLTLWLHDETFIKIKPTIYYAVVTALLVFGMATGRNLLKAVLGSAYPGLSERGWHLLTRNWAAYFGVMAVLNEVVWRTQTTNFWVSFKLWFFLPATFVFAALNVPMLMRHGLTLEEAEEEQPTLPTE
ncbi:septation protein A [Sphingosinicella ginsenosidimutans]|uniref:Inner membrane-spanning protein YciB n=1 Tax=Allosphingosinicella ginsenosidimutans TaxID=1176539 RepID=A0A5C6TW25_9SPHN|nr:inner membrane-spanning protein YciB [Sphingosinicella ginsenosidimutans]TXC64360.1 septation protein IspZ [Sphingosinicella ginsenosidimutans]